MAAASGIAPDFPRLQRGANLSQLHSRCRPLVGKLKIWRSARDSNPGHHCWCDCFQDSALDRPDALLSLKNGSPAWTCTTTSRLTDGHAALTSPGNGPSARFRAAVVRLSGGCSAIELRRIGKKWSRAPVLPRVPPRSKRGGFADSLAREFKNGCGGRIRTGDTRRMKPLPYHLATPLLVGKTGTASRCCPGPARIWRPRCAGWRPPCDRN